MKRFKLFLPVLLMICVLGSSCVSRKPYATVEGSPDYNQRRHIQGAKFKKRLNGLGIGVTVGLSAAGGYAMYKSDLIKFYDKEGTQTSKPALNAAVGAVSGYAISRLAGLIMGEGRILKVNSSMERESWIKKFDHHALYVKRKDSWDNFTFIDKRVATNYKVLTMKDAFEYSILFPKSNNHQDIINQTNKLKSLDRNRLPILIKQYELIADVSELKRRYIVQSPSIDALFSAKAKYNEIKIDIEPIAVSLIKNCKDALTFKNKFPISKFLKQAVLNGTVKGNDDAIRELHGEYGSNFILSASDLEELKATEVQRKAYLNALFVVEKPKDIYDIVLFYHEYSWLNYRGKPEDILKNYWEKGYKTLEDGNALIYAIEKLAQNRAYKSWQISKELVEEFLKRKLSQEITQSVYVSSPLVKESYNPDWEAWENNTDYTAGIVAEEGDLKYILYGTVTNKSKFDLPISIDVQTQLRANRKIRGRGWLRSLGDFIGLSVGDSHTIGEKGESFHINYLPAGQSSLYAVLIDYGAQSKREGVNIGETFDLIKVLEISRKEAKPSFRTENFTWSRSQLQKSWQLMAKNGLPNAGLTDTWRNKAFDQKEWDDKLAKRLEAKRRARLEAEMANVHGAKVFSKTQNIYEVEIERHIAANSYHIAINCDKYAHETGKENDGFKARLILDNDIGDCNQVTYKDSSSGNELVTYCRGPATLNVSYYNRKKELVSFSVRFESGGYYFVNVYHR